MTYLNTIYSLSRDPPLNFYWPPLLVRVVVEWPLMVFEMTFTYTSNVKATCNSDISILCHHLFNTILAIESRISVALRLLNCGYYLFSVFNKKGIPFFNFCDSKINLESLFFKYIIKYMVSLSKYYVYFKINAHIVSNNILLYQEINELSRTKSRYFSY